jgi:serine/threonine protein kinase
LLARDDEGGRLVALKTQHGRPQADLKAYELFEREAQVLLGLRHEGIPAFVELLHADVAGTPATFLVMEFIEGVSLARMIEDRAVLDSTRVLDLLLELLGILDYLHGRVPPILHRDIKPSNVIVRPSGVPVLVDFGAMRQVFRASSESGSSIVGTYGYMPYEQYMGQASPASDLYALGGTFLHLVTGRPPAEFMTEEGRIAVPPALPGGEPLRGVIARLLEPSPARRFATARAAREALLHGPPQPGTAVLAASDARVPVPLELDQAPRELTGAAVERFRQLAHSPWRLMDPTPREDDGWGVFDVATLVFFSLVTAGVLPLVFIGIARARRRRLRKFFRDGHPAMAEVLAFKQEDLAFDVKLTRVRYEFAADGATRRGSDLVLPPIADRWRAGDRIEVLYLAERGYDSVIVSVE